MYKIHPAGHRVLIKLDPVVETSKGGIIISSGKDQKRESQGMETGEVLELGPTAYKDFGEAWVKVGDKVKFKRYEGVYEEVGEVGYRILNDDDIFAIVEGEAQSN